MSQGKKREKPQRWFFITWQGFPKHISLKSTYTWISWMLRLPHFYSSLVSASLPSFWEELSRTGSRVLSAGLSTSQCGRPGTRSAWSASLSGCKVVFERQPEMWWAPTTLSRIGHFYPAFHFSLSMFIIYPWWEEMQICVEESQLLIAQFSMRFFVSKRHNW